MPSDPIGRGSPTTVVRSRLRATTLRLLDRALYTVDGLWRRRGRRTLAATRLGQLAKRRRQDAIRRALAPRAPQHGSTAATPPVAVRTRVPPPERAEARSPRDPRHVLLISHCDFTSPSALHVYAIASELHARELVPTMAVPRDPAGVRRVGRPPFAVVDYTDARAHPPADLDLVHAFSPRERVRKLTFEIADALGCPYVVHLEDNDEAVLEREVGMTIDELRRVPLPVLDAALRANSSHPLRAPAFVAGAAGVTVVIERLLERKPDDVPGVVAWPGFDEAVLAPPRPRDAVREELRLEPDDIAVLYTGNIHDSNEAEMLELYEAVRRLREEGLPVVLVKTGWNFVDLSRFPRLGTGLRDLGYVAREDVPSLLAAADVLVQPGRPDPFNDYRFPSKLPEFLASGRPVVLPRTNIGLQLADGEEALLLERGDADEIADKVAVLARDAALRERLGRDGRAFALRELRWSRSVDRIVDLYRRAAAHGGRRELAEPPPLVELVSTDATPLPEGYDAVPPDTASVRKRTLAALERAPAQEPVVFVAGPVDERVRAAAAAAVRQFYALRGYWLTDEQGTTVVG